MSDPLSFTVTPAGTLDVEWGYLPPRSHCCKTDDLPTAQGYKYLCLSPDLWIYTAGSPPAGFAESVALYEATSPASLADGIWTVSWDGTAASIVAAPGATWDGGHADYTATHALVDLPEAIFGPGKKALFRSKSHVTPGWASISVAWRAMDGDTARIDYQTQAHAILLDTDTGAVSIASAHTDTDGHVTVSPTVGDTETFATSALTLAEPGSNQSMRLVLLDAYSDRDCLGD